LPHDDASGVHAALKRFVDELVFPVLVGAHDGEDPPGAALERADVGACMGRRADRLEVGANRCVLLHEHLRLA